MVVVTTNQDDFEYDIHSLVKAFYPGVEVKVFLGDEGKESFSSAPGFPDISINFIRGRILLMIFADDEGEKGYFDNFDEELSEEERVHREIVKSNEGRSDFQVKGIDINDGMSRLEVKNALKQLIYLCLSDYTGIILPWGALTGIRPAKITMKLLNSGMNEDEIVSHMQEVYFCSKEKVLLALDIAKREREILRGIELEDSYSLYITIPFCPTTCLYCSFTSYPIGKFEHLSEGYLAALYKEIDFIADFYKERQLTTVYIGGGTPTTLSVRQLRELLKKLRSCFDLSQIKEFTFEAGRPDSITREKLEILMAYGVSRISINPQSMNDKTLDLIGRKHTGAQVYEAFSLARDVGFVNINMDLILGLPGEGISDVAVTMKAVKELKPDSLTVHSLAIKRASGLAEWVSEYGLVSLINTEETMNLALETAAELGMRPYYLYRQKNIAGNFENIGFACENKDGLYNVLMMEEVQTIAALGAGSVTKFVAKDRKISRCDNVKEVDQYINRIDEMINRKKALLLTATLGCE